MMNLLSLHLVTQSMVMYGLKDSREFGTCRLHPLPPSLTQPQTATTSPTPMGKIIQLLWGRSFLGEPDELILAPELNP